MIKNDWNETVTAQEVLDHAFQHLCEQKRRCDQVAPTGGFSCLYRNDVRGMACGAGCLLSDKEADAIDDAHFNYKSWSALTQDSDLVPMRLRPHFNLICDIQQVHDSCQELNPDGFVAYIENQFLGVALRYNLRAPVLQ